MSLQMKKLDYIIGFAVTKCNHHHKVSIEL